MGTLAEITINGKVRKLGCLEDDTIRAPNYKNEFALTSDQPILSPVDLSYFNTEVLDQGSSNACGGYAAVECFEILWHLVYNKKIEFSRTFPYALSNRDIDAGSRLYDVFDALRTYGVCERHLFPHNNLFKSQISQEAFSNAKRYRLNKFMQIFDYQTLCYAIRNLHPIAFGIRVGYNFEVDSNGVLLKPANYIGGHGMTIVGIVWHNALDRFVIKAKNSWGSDWGVNGYCYLTEEHFPYFIYSFAAVYPHDDPTVMEIPHVKHMVEHAKSIKTTFDNLVENKKDEKLSMPEKQ